MLGESQKNWLKNLPNMISKWIPRLTWFLLTKEIGIIMLGEEFRGKSCYANFFKLKNNIMLGEFHVSRGHVRRGLGV